MPLCFDDTAIDVSAAAVATINMEVTPMLKALGITSMVCKNYTLLAGHYSVRLSVHACQWVVHNYAAE